MPVNWSYFTRLEERHMLRKLAAVRAYRSQAAKVYTNETFIDALARVNGVRVGAEYAEGFEVLRWVI